MAKKREQNFTATIEDFQNIMKDLYARKFSPLYVLTGDEPYFIDKISDFIASNVMPEDTRDFNQDVLYGNDCDAATVINYCRTFPMMTEKRVVILREATQMSDFAKLEKYFDSPMSTTILVVCYKGKTLDKRQAVTKKAIANAVFFESVTARDYEIKQYLSELVSSHNFTIDFKAKELLVEHLGCSLKKIDNELTKLLSAMGEGERVINSAHIEKYIGISKDYNIFELTSAIGTKNAVKALAIAAYFEENSKNNPLVVTIPSVFKYMLSVFAVGMIILEHNKKRVPMPSNFEMARMAKLSGAYFVDKYIAASRIYPPSKALAILGIIRKYDMKSKGVETGSLTDGEILRELLLKIFTI